MDQNELLTSSVPRALENKNKLFGFEVPDLLIIFIHMASMNLIFGSTRFRYPLVWGSTFLIAGFLFFIKKGKPDRYLQHLIEFYSKPHLRSAGAKDLQYRRWTLKD